MVFYIRLLRYLKRKSYFPMKWCNCVVWPAMHVCPPYTVFTRDFFAIESLRRLHMSVCVYTIREKYRIIYGLSWITMLFGHEWGDSPIIFTSDAVTSENHWRITQWVTKTSLLMATNFLHAFLVLKHREIHENSHRSIAASLLFTVDQSVVALWRQVNTYCDIILTDCSQNVS